MGHNGEQLASHGFIAPFYASRMAILPALSVVASKQRPPVLSNRWLPRGLLAETIEGVLETSCANPMP